MKELSADLQQQIDTLCGEGDVLADQEKFAKSLDCFQRAWELLPEPRHEWAEATFVLGSIGDIRYLAGDFNRAIEALEDVKKCPGAMENPFLRLRLGQAYFDSQNQDNAEQELASAYLLGGLDIFEDEEPKYWEWISSKMDEPAEGW